MVTINNNDNATVILNITINVIKKRRANGINKGKRLTKRQIEESHRVKRTDFGGIDLTKLTKGRKRCDCQGTPNARFGLARLSFG